MQMQARRAAERSGGLLVIAMALQLLCRLASTCLAAVHRTAAHPVKVTHVWRLEERFLRLCVAIGLCVLRASGLVVCLFVCMLSE